MDKDAFNSWLLKLGKAWSDRSPDEAAALFSKDCKYYEHALEEPCKNWDDILKLWLVVPQNQKDVKFQFNIISVSENVGIVNFWVSRTLLPSNNKQLINGIFQVSLNDQGLCNYFKQWTVKKNI